MTKQEINARIIAKGNQMASEIKDAIVKIALHNTLPANISTSKDVPSRPWMLTGGVCVAAGIIGIMSSDSNWPYFMGALGLGSLYVGFSKRTQQDSPNSVHYGSTINMDEEKAFIIEKCNKILDSKKKEWDAFMDQIKIEMQSLIKESALSDEKREEYLSLTYYPETLSLSTISLIDQFDSIGNSSDSAIKIMSKKEDFANEISLSVIRVANSQVQVFNKITL